MKLNRYNYEEYFILYMDNELSSDDRREVEIFLQQNPDLKAEMDMLLHSKLTPDTDINFTDKGSLMRFGSNSVNMTNYEEWLLSYIDDELDNEEKKEVEEFVVANPAIQKELSLLQKAKLRPEAIVFPDKESLYRREEKVKVIAIRWWRIAAAAVLLIGIATAGIVLLNNKPENGTDKVAESKKTETPVNLNNNNKVTPNQAQKINTEKREEIADVTHPKKNEFSSIEGKKPVANKGDDKLALQKKNEPEEVKKDDAIIASVPEKPNSNNLARPDQNPNVIGGSKDNDMVKTEEPSPEILTTKKENPDKDVVTTAKLESSDLPEQSNRSNKGIRGFLRKVTRTFEKRTNIKATDDDDRLLIAGLSIKMN
jgi:hypothetical protein